MAWDGLGNYQIIWDIFPRFLGGIGSLRQQLKYWLPGLEVFEIVRAKLLKF